MADDLWHDALTRRLRSLLKTEPLHRPRWNEGRLAALLRHDDPTALCVKALEVLVDALGLRPGATRAEIAAGLMPGHKANNLRSRDPARVGPGVDYVW